LKSMAKTWHDRYLDSDDETGPRERSKTVVSVPSIYQDRI
jgi:hypothetical protein